MVIQETPMSDEILVNVTPTETRVALVEDGLLQEVHIERERNKGLVGNIYKGKVQRVLPGMQSAFIEIGLEKSGFLHIADILQETEQSDEAVISDLLYEGQSLLVQVMKDPLGNKGARLTTQLTLSSRYLVYLPQVEHVGVSKRIDNEDEKQRVKTIVTELKNTLNLPGGFIVRTSGEGFSRDEYLSDIQFLVQLWNELQQQHKNQIAPAVVYKDMSLYMRTIRDLVKVNIDRVRVDSKDVMQQMSVFASTFEPKITKKLEYYNGETPLFDLYNVEDEIQRSLHRQVPLKSGGYLVIDQTEAMTTIDINTGKFVGKKSQQETLLKTNLEATTALARQLRIRNLGGIIIIDFIDMKNAEHKEQVLKALEKALEKDSAKTTVTGLSQLGLVEMTRKRTTESLGHILCEPCATCEGRGQIKTVETVCYEIFRELLRNARKYDNQGYRVFASPVVVECLLNEEASGLADLEQCIGKPITIEIEPSFNQEQFDVVPR